MVAKRKGQIEGERQAQVARSAGMAVPAVPMVVRVFVGHGAKVEG